MDPSGVLLALEERERWQERLERIEDRIRQLERRRMYLLRELDHARKKVSEYASFLAGRRQPVQTLEPATPPHLFLR